MKACEKIGLSVQETAETLGVSRPTVYRLLDRSDFPVVRIGRRVLIPRQGLMDWIAKEAKQS